MKSRSCKDIVCVTLVSVLLVTVPVKSDEDSAEAKSNFTKSSDTNVRPVLVGINAGKQEIPIVAGRRPSLLVPTPPKNSEEEDTAKESVAGIHDNNSKGADYESEKKVNHGVELRSNLSSSSSVESAGVPPSKHSLFADHSEEEDASGTAEVPNHSLNSNVHAVSLHEHIERYHQHQGSDEDLDVHQPSFNSNPVEDTPGSNVADAVVVSSESFPVRLGPNTRLRGNNYNSPVSKPIPILRQENENAAQILFGNA